MLIPGKRRHTTGQTVRPPNMAPTPSPKHRINLGAVWKIGTWTVQLRESIYGPSSEYGTEDGGEHFEADRSAKARPFSIDANNLFNTYPEQNSAGLLAAQPAGINNAAVSIYPSFVPSGTNGDYYDARLNCEF